VPEPTAGRTTGSAPDDTTTSPIAGRDAGGRRALFEAELRAARLAPPDYALPVADRERLFAMWEDHLPQRDALRAAAIDLPEEPNFMLKPALPGGGGA
jgi:hypothetical protein